MTTSLDYNLTSLQYWEAVRLCLLRFHGYAAEEAAGRVGAHRDWLRQQDEFTRDMAEHQEPFYAANDLAGKEIELDRFDEPYGKILTRASKS